jgi:hypothetical protein
MYAWTVPPNSSTARLIRLTHPPMSLDLVRLQTLAQGRRPHDVGEERADRAKLVSGGRRRRLKLRLSGWGNHVRGGGSFLGGAAPGAEPRAGRQRLAASLARLGDAHPPTIAQPRAARLHNAGDPDTSTLEITV